MDDIRSDRERLGLTQTEFADRLGLNQSTISRLETGALDLDKRTRLAVQALLVEAGLRAGEGDDRKATVHEAGASRTPPSESPDNSAGQIGAEHLPPRVPPVRAAATPGAEATPQANLRAAPGDLFADAQGHVLEERTRLCPACEAESDSPVTRGCTDPGCPRKIPA